MSDYLDMYLGKNIVNMFGWKASFLNKKKHPFPTYPSVSFTSDIVFETTPPLLSGCCNDIMS